MNPDHLRYTVEHEWVELTAEGTARFGITDYAQEALGDIVFVTLPSVGATVTSGQPCGEVESTKSVSDVYAPVSGEVVGHNEAVETAPETLNSDPYGAGWIAEVSLADPTVLDSLLDADGYEAYLAGLER